MAMTPIPLHLHSPMNATLASSNAKLAKLPQPPPRVRHPPAANVPRASAHASQHKHDPVAVFQTSDPEIQTTSDPEIQKQGSLMRFRGVVF
jgi:hypothetical protein